LLLAKEPWDLGTLEDLSVFILGRLKKEYV
jgi:hypothetical protein